MWPAPEAPNGLPKTTHTEATFSWANGQSYGPQRFGAPTPPCLPGAASPTSCSPTAETKRSEPAVPYTSPSVGVLPPSRVPQPLPTQQNCPFAPLFEVGMAQTPQVTHSSQRRASLKSFVGIKDSGRSGVCWNYTNGRCVRDDCRYSHDATPAPRMSLSRSSTPTSRSAPGLSDMPYGLCWEFLERGLCSKRMCFYRHSTREEIESQRREETPFDRSRSSSPQQRLCRNYMQHGHCGRVQCRFLHDFVQPSPPHSRRSAPNVLGTHDQETPWYDAPRQHRGRDEGHWVSRASFGSPVNRLCYDYQAMGCARGAACRFSHVLPGEQQWEHQRKPRFL